MEIFKHYSFEKTSLIEELIRAVVKVVTESKDVNSITVKQVINEAHVARSSFYRFFFDIYDLENYVYFGDIEFDKAKSDCKSLKELMICKCQYKNVGL